MKFNTLALVAMAILANAGASAADKAYFDPTAKSANSATPVNPASQPMAEFTAVLFAAMTNENGMAKAEAKGAMAQSIKQANKTNSPMFVEAKRLSEIKDGDNRKCYNMKLRITMPELMGRGGVPVDFGYDVKMCSDGQPPTEAVQEERRFFRNLEEQQKQKKSIK